MNEVLYLPAEQLSIHPDNPRRFYKAEDLQALASSIREGGGVDQALIVVPDPVPCTGRCGHLPKDTGTGVPDGSEHFLVLDGNYRLAAARVLGPAPQFQDPYPERAVAFEEWWQLQPPAMFVNYRTACHRAFIAGYDMQRARIEALERAHNAAEAWGEAISVWGPHDERTTAALVAWDIARAALAAEEKP